MIASDDSARHEEAWRSLPWLANGRLSQAERDNIEPHVRACAACREELAFQRLLCNVLTEPDRVTYAPGPSFRKLMDRIDGTAPPARKAQERDKAPVASIRASGRQAHLPVYMASARTRVGGELYSRDRARRYCHHRLSIVAAPLQNAHGCNSRDRKRSAHFLRPLGHCRRSGNGFALERRPCRRGTRQQRNLWGHARQPRPWHGHSGACERGTACVIGTFACRSASPLG